MKVAIYPGTFDPITKGHIDIIVRSIKFVDKLIIAVSNNNKKNTLFKINERVEMVKEVLQDEKISNVEVDSFEGLMVDHAVKHGAVAAIRGLRALSDFEFEFQLALMNRKLEEEIETIFMMPREAYTFLSSKLVKEIAQLGGDVCHRAPVETGVHGVHGVEDGQGTPVGQPTERVVALGQVVQSLPLRGVGQDPLLLLAGKEHDVGPARDRIQHEAAGE